MYFEEGGREVALLPFFCRAANPPSSTRLSSSSLPRCEIPASTRLSSSLPSCEIPASTRCEVVLIRCATLVLNPAARLHFSFAAPPFFFVLRGRPSSSHRDVHRQPSTLAICRHPEPRCYAHRRIRHYRARRTDVDIAPFVAPSLPRAICHRRRHYRVEAAKASPQQAVRGPVHDVMPNINQVDRLPASESVVQSQLQCPLLPYFGLQAGPSIPHRSLPRSCLPPCSCLPPHFVRQSIPGSNRT